MTGKGLLRSGLCLVAIGGGTIVLHAEPAPIPVAPAAPCIDGSCVPRRLTNGYYQTKWRRWPVEPSAAARPGVREGISAPPVELPDREQEAAIPPGAFAAPSPSDQQPSDSGFPPSRSTVPTAPPPSGTTPRERPEADLPPELRGSPLPRMDDPLRGYPSWNPRTPAITASLKKRSDSQQAPRNDGSRQHGEEPHVQSLPVPGVLPAAAPSARPIASPPSTLPTQATDEQARWHGRATQPAQTSLNQDNKPMAAKWSAWSRLPDGSARHDLHASYDTHKARAGMQLTEELALQSAPANVISRTRGPLDESRVPAAPQSSLNMPAAIGEPSSSRVVQASANAILREPASNVAAVLAVRAEGPSLPLDRPMRNPLRGTNRIALDAAGTSDQPSSAPKTSGAIEQTSSAAKVFVNPLR